MCHLFLCCPSMTCIYPVACVSCIVHSHSEHAYKCWGLGRSERLEAACKPFTHCKKKKKKSPFKRAPIINNSCPGYVNPALESTSSQIPFILGLLPAVQWTELKASKAQRQPLSKVRTQYNFLKILKSLSLFYFTFYWYSKAQISEQAFGYVAQP